MKLGQLTLLSIGTMVLLSGCYERGKAVPPNAKKLIKKKKEKKVYDFPVLKLSANENNKNTAEEILAQKPKSKQQPSETTDKASTSQSLRFPKMPKETAKTTVSIAPEEKAIKKISQQIELSSKVTKESKELQVQVPDNTKATSTPVKMKVVKKVVKNPIKKKIRKRANKPSSSSQIPIVSAILKPNVSLQDIPIINKILPKPSAKSKGRIKNHTKANRPKKHSRTNRDIDIPVLDAARHRNSAMSFSGGTSSTHLDIAKIRVETDNYQTNIVLDSYQWAGYNAIPTEPSTVSGVYFFNYEPHNNRIVGNIKGYNTFSALLTKQDEMLKNNPMVRSIYIDRYIGDDGIKFIIELKEKAKVNVIDVEDPGSIIIELYPLNK